MEEKLKVDLSFLKVVEIDRDFKETSIICDYKGIEIRLTYEDFKESSVLREIDGLVTSDLGGNSPDSKEAYLKTLRQMGFNGNNNEVSSKFPITKTVKQTGFALYGIAIINMWGGGQGEVEMNLVTISFDKLKPGDLNMVDNPEIIESSVNDGGFGNESIESAEVFIDAVYEDGSRNLYDQFYITF